ncbi:B-cell antigen receptor complex-associated protein beta chain-like isoform X1 [Gadus chalcogrammus]|uniref:B-cell antigen receptor complex-associated protein beta chain-like isoform X1 n=1 Tax=Gadus chalcogrammus TaxID=1042646 RepID=UPI0024C49A4F|nr:B-cell antigen receptor complex-associated protein beta chain-like isoform X1 [Gadus chalcogrammus]
MLWLLVGLCGLALVNLSAPLPQAAITQKPRFYGVMERRRAIIYCEYPLDPLDPPLLVDWFWAKDSDSVARAPMRPTGKVAIKGKTERKHAFLFLKDVSPSNSGVYYCQVNGTWGAGTGLQVMPALNVSKAEKRSKMKDAFIILQTLMLAICAAAPLVQRYILVKKEDVIYEDPQQDHTYEGLVVETCEGALYEDISAYAQTGGPEAPWED